MAIRVTGLKLGLDRPEKDIATLVARKLGVRPDKLTDLCIVRRSVDARKKDKICFVYAVEVEVGREESKILTRLGKDPQVAQVKQQDSNQEDEFPNPKSRRMNQETPMIDHDSRLITHESRLTDRQLGNRPVVVGAGPAGMFAALTLAWQGYNPLVLEQGQDVVTRTRDVEHFWATGQLEPWSNVQFGEGGAGTFSDGKLTTRISDRRINLVLETMVRAGAPEEIMWLQKPHVGTDRLKQVVANMRQMMLEAGGQVSFGSRVTRVILERGKVTGVEVTTTRQGELETQVIPTSTVILALGHSSRETYRMLEQEGVEMGAKALAIGVRIEHPQQIIDTAQYGNFAGHPKLGAAEYQLTYQDKESGRGAYTFCMCPGGEVVGAASGAEQVVTNGMSDLAREGKWANSALVASVGPKDYDSSGALAGVEFLEKWEHSAYKLGGSDFTAPAQRVEDFLAGRPGSQLPEGMGTYRPGLKPADLHDCLPEYVAEMLEKAIIDMGRKLQGFDSADALLTGVETRTSAPLRIFRDEGYQALGITGLYPAGEGAGYAGGIMSASVDGIKVAEAVIRKLAGIGLAP